MFFFFFKQKTAYEMRISDWSSDVCSSDLDATSPDGQVLRLFTDTGGGMNLTTRGADKLGLAYDKDNNLGSEHEPVFGTTPWPAYSGPWIRPPKSAAVRLATLRSEERHAGKERVSTCTYRWLAYPYNNNIQQLRKYTLD